MNYQNYRRNKNKGIKVIIEIMIRDRILNRINKDNLEMVQTFKDKIEMVKLTKKEKTKKNYSLVTLVIRLPKKN